MCEAGGNQDDVAGLPATTTAPFQSHSERLFFMTTDVSCRSENALHGLLMELLLKHFHLIASNRSDAKITRQARRRAVNTSDRPVSIAVAFFNSQRFSSQRSYLLRILSSDFITI